METKALIDMIAARFAALAHPHRIEIVRLLLAAYNAGGMTAGALQERLRMPGSTLNHHLGKLEQAGLVASRRDRQWVWYSARAEGLREMQEFLFRECCTANDVVRVEQLMEGGKITT